MDKSSFVDPNSVKSHYNMTSSNHLFGSPQHGGRVPNIRDKEGNAKASVPYLSTPSCPSLFGDTMQRDLIGHLQKPTPLSMVFFSEANVDALQKSIQDQVYRMSGNKYHIDRQDDQQLKIIMRSYYLMYAKNNDANVSGELADLNGRVIGYSSAKVYSEVDFNQFYVADLEEFAPPIANPMNVGVYGTRTGELKSFF
jgi:hypothetical protein